MNKPSEYDIQVSLFKFADLMSREYPELDMLWGSMNGIWIQGPNKWAIIKKAQNAGCLPKGYPDIGLDLARKGYHGFRMELKRKKGSPVSPEQKRRLKRLSEEGYYSVVAYGLDEAKENLMRYITNE